MHNQFDPQYDTPVAAQPATEFVPDGLFSHPDADYATTNPGSPPEESQRSYTGLFQEPADGADDSQSAA